MVNGVNGHSAEEASALARSILEAMGDQDESGPGVPRPGDDEYEVLGESNQYGPWLDLLRYFGDGDMSNIMRPYRYAEIDDAQRHLSMLMFEVGRRQEAATCANRVGKLNELELMLQMLALYQETGKFPDDEKFTKALGSQMSVMKAELRAIQTRYRDPKMALMIRQAHGDDVSQEEIDAAATEESSEDGYKKHLNEYIDAKAAVIAAEIQIVSLKMAHEEADGVDVDYTRMKTIYRDYAQTGISGTVVEELFRSMPSGYQWGYLYLLSTNKESADQHQQALIAKVVATVSGVLSKNTQSQGKRRRRYSHYDEDAEYL